MQFLFIVILLSFISPVFSENTHSQPARTSVNSNLDKELEDALLHSNDNYSQAISDMILDKLVFDIKQHKYVHIYQNIFSISTFILSTSLLVFGVFLSYSQFKSESTIRSKMIEVLEEDIGDKKIKNKDKKEMISLLQNISETGSVTEAELFKFKIKSSVIGLIILTISLGYYYLFLTNVYPIK